MKFHQLPKTIEQHRLPQEILRSYSGEIDRFVDDTWTINDREVAAQLSQVVKINAFRKGKYVGFASRVWRIEFIEIANKLMDPPIPFATLRLTPFEDPDGEAQTAG